VNPFGTGRAPSEAGNASVSFIVTGTSPEDVAAKVSTLRGLPYRGTQRLFLKHRNGNIMWTWGMFSSVRGAQNVQNMPHQRQRITATVQCQDSRWYYKPNQYFLNDGYTFTDGLTFPSIKLDQASVANNDIVTVTNYGNAPVAPYIRWDIPAGVTVANPTLTWDNPEGQTVYSVQYTDSLTEYDVVTIDCSAQAVKPTYANLTTTHGAWLEIPPGTHTLTVTGTFSADALLTIDFWDVWV
jgi:hypothetical protein